MKTVFKTCLVLFSAILLAGCAQKEENDTRLQAPYSLKVSSENVLTWSIVKGAVAYLPNINGEDCEKVTSNQLSLSDVAEGGHLIIKVKAIGDGATWLDSDWSEQLEYDMAIALAAPVPVVSGKTVSWEPVTGASKYEYSINGSLVLTEDTTIDLSGYLAERYTITVRALPSDNHLNTLSGWSSEVVVAIFDRLATPALIVTQPSLKNTTAASVSWDVVEGASDYDVYVDDIKQECEGTSLDFTGKSGSFNVKVTAINPGIYDSSETAETTIILNDYGKGTESDPYKIYSASDWNDFSDLVSTDEGIAGYQDKYLEVVADIDFKDTYVSPAGKSALLSFKGTLDGKNHTLKNAKIGDGTSSHQAFFYLLNGTVKNMKFDNITVLSSDSSAGGDHETSAGVIAAGNNGNAFTLENCHVSNSSVASGRTGDKYGAYAGGLVGRSNNNMSIINCSVTCTKVACLTQCSGGVVGVFSNGIIDFVLSSGNTVSSANNSGGIAGSIGPDAQIINCSSSDNTCSVSMISAGGVVGANSWLSASSGNVPELVNILSKGNTVKSTNDQSIQYMGLLVGCRGTNDDKMSMKNCLVLSGKAEYAFTGDDKYPHAACVGIMIGYGSPTFENCFYNQNYRSKFDTYLYENTVRTDGKSGGWYRDAVGQKQSNIISDSKGGKSATGVTSYLETPLKDGTCLAKLNDWVDANKSNYTTLKAWIVDDNGFPKINQ